MSKVNLEPCPFCGGKAKMKVSGTEFLFAVVCDSCGYATPCYMKEKQAAEAWNRRTERTCHLIPYEVEEDTGFFDCMECDSCGFVMDVSEAAYYNFCSHCGSRVVVG